MTKIYSRRKAIKLAKETGKMVSYFCEKTGILNGIIGTKKQLDIENDVTISVYNNALRDDKTVPDWFYTRELPDDTLIDYVHYLITDSMYYCLDKRDNNGNIV